MGFSEKVDYAPVEVLTVPVPSITGAIEPVPSITGVTSVETVSTEPVATGVEVLGVVDDWVPGIVHAERRETRTRERAIAFIKEKIKK